MAPVFSDNMVLQRDVAIPLPGMAKNLKVVTVNFDGIENEARVTNTFRTDQFDPNAEHWVLGQRSKFSFHMVPKWIAFFEIVKILKVDV